MFIFNKLFIAYKKIVFFIGFFICSFQRNKSNKCLKYTLLSCPINFKKYFYIIYILLLTLSISIFLIQTTSIFNYWRLFELSSLILLQLLCLIIIIFIYNHIFQVLFKNAILNVEVYQPDQIHLGQNLKLNPFQNNTNCNNISIGKEKLKFKFLFTKEYFQESSNFLDFENFQYLLFKMQFYVNNVWKINILKEKKYTKYLILIGLYFFLMAIILIQIISFIYENSVIFEVKNYAILYIIFSFLTLSYWLGITIYTLKQESLSGTLNATNNNFQPLKGCSFYVNKECGIYDNILAENQETLSKMINIVSSVMYVILVTVLLNIVKI